jgi:hypothetical protein
MATQSDFRMEEKDEFPHRPDTSVNFNESVYTNAFDAKTRTGGWMRLGNRVNEGYAELSVCLYLPDGRIACQFGRPKIADNDGFSAGGLSYRVIEPFRRQAMAYDGDVYLIEDPEGLRDPKALFTTAPKLRAEVAFEVSADSPIHGGEPLRPDVPTMYGRDFSLGHFNQHTRAVGSMKVGGEVYPIDGHGWRDHSWGPRYWQAIYAYRLFIANFGEGRGFMLLKIWKKGEPARRIGVLLVDGAYEEVIDLDVSTDWTAKWDPRRVTIGVRTANRAVQIDAEILTLAPLRNRREAGGEILVSRVAEGFTRYSWDGRSGYGMTEYIERLDGDTPVGVPV